jgi:hypothetical protein
MPRNSTLVMPNLGPIMLGWQSLSADGKAVHIFAVISHSYLLQFTTITN